MERPVETSVAETPVPASVPMAEAAPPDLGDPAVLAEMREDFLEAWEWLYSSQTPHNLDDLSDYFAPLPENVDDPAFQPGTTWWYSLEVVRSELQADAEVGLLWRIITQDGAWVVSLESHASDNSWVVVQGRYSGSCWIEAVDTSTGEVADSREGQCMQYIAGMVWDGDSWRWKIASLWQRDPNPTQSGGTE